MIDIELTYRPADEESARKFLRWQYEPPYDVYNCPPDQLEKWILYNADPANNVYGMFDRNDELVGYCSYGRDAQVPGGDYSDTALDIGLMIKPELTGRGMGASFAREVIRNGVEIYNPEKLRVTIAGFNHRAIRTWEKNGFQKVQEFIRNRDGMAFVIMAATVGG